MSIIERVDAIIKDSLFKDEEVKDTALIDRAVAARGIVMNLGFHPERLEANREKVVEIVREVVQDEFFRSKGGGYSTLALCQDRATGDVWGEHRDMDALLCLCIGLKLASFLLPREMWVVMPGGMPYVVFEDLP